MYIVVVMLLLMLMLLLLLSCMCMPRKSGRYYAPSPNQNRLSRALRSRHFLRWKRKSKLTLVIAIINWGFLSQRGGP